MHFYGKSYRKFSKYASHLREMLQETLWEILWEILWEMLQEMLQKNLVGNCWGNDAVFSLNMWLKMIYCLQSIHEPACVILTLFQFVFKVSILTHYCSKFPSQPIIVQSLHFGQLLLAHLESAYSLIWGSHEIWGKGGGHTLALL